MGVVGVRRVAEVPADELPVATVSSEEAFSLGTSNCLFGLNEKRILLLFGLACVLV